jgi:putative DNA methylase
MTHRKKLIEVALPLEAINVASAREKSIRHGHPSTLHLWWARRPLAACRAVIFTSLVDDPDDPHAPPDFVAACKALPKGKNATAEDTPRQRLFDFIERLVTWEATTDEKILNTARELIRLSTDGNPPPLLDPFAGGGSIPLEAQRLGLEAHASDLNPVAVMINKALIEIPPKFANQPPVNPGARAASPQNGPRKQAGLPALQAKWKGAAGLAADVRYYGEWMREKAYEKIGNLYPEMNGETVIAWLWARTVKCPNPACAAQMPLVRSFDLSKKKGKRAWVEPQVDPKTRQITFTVKQASTGKGPQGIVNRRGARCIACETPVPFDHIRKEGRAGRMSQQLMAIVTEGQNGRNYHSPDPEHVHIAEQAQPAWKPDHPLPYNPRDFKTPNYGMTTFADLFTPRQLTALTTFSDLVTEARTQIQADALAAGLLDDETPLRSGGTGAYAYTEAVSVYLSMGVSKLADYNCSLVTWSQSRDQAAHAFTKQALPMVWDFAEVNVFAGAAGDLTTTLAGIGRTVERVLARGKIIGIALQQDATSIQKSSAICISTDPPYYDNIGYADLSDFFYVWVRASMRHIYPEIFGTMLVPKELELVASAYRFNGNKDSANEHFEEGLMRAFEQMRRLIPREYPLTVYYAFKQQEIVLEEGSASTGWETMLNGLISTGFSIVGTWPMRTERSVRSIGIGTNALASSIVLVCRPRPDDAPITSRRDFVNALRRELPAALRQMQSGNIAPVDLAQASIGPGMAVYSRYRQVLEANGDPLTVRTALQLINQVLDEFLAETEGDLDGDSRFAVAWFEQYGFNSGQFGVADVLARAKNTSVDGLHNAGLLAASAGSVRLLTWEELDPGWQPADDDRPTVWEATHHLIERLNVHGEEGAALLLAKMNPDLAASARQLAYRLYAICERKGWADHARDYNALVTSWSASQERAAEVKQSYRQDRLFD